MLPVPLAEVLVQGPVSVLTLAGAVPGVPTLGARQQLGARPAPQLAGEAYHGDARVAMVMLQWGGGPHMQDACDAFDLALACNSSVLG